MCTVLVHGTRKVPAYGRVGGHCVESFTRFTGEKLFSHDRLEGVDGVEIHGVTSADDHLKYDVTWTLFDGVSSTVLKGKTGAAQVAAEIAVQNLRHELRRALTSNITEIDRNAAVEEVYRKLRGL